MKPLFFAAGLLALAAAGAVVWSGSTDEPQASGADEALKARFVGHYELVEFVRFGEDGEAVDTGYEGRIMYDGFGNMSAIGMPRDLPERPAEPGERRQAGFAYWATVSFDLDNDIVVHHVQGSPTRGSWVGEDNVRYFEWDGDLLKLSIRDEEGRVTGTLTWRKFGPEPTSEP